MRTKRLFAAVLVLSMVLCWLPEYGAYAEETVHILDVSADMEAFSASADNEGTEIVVNEYFIVLPGSKTKVDSSNKTFDDGYVGSQRLSFQGKTKLNDQGLILPAVKFTTSAPANVKLWWVCGYEGRQMAILNEAGEEVVRTNETLEKNGKCISELTVDRAGTYYLGTPDGSNYLFKMEVTEQAAPEIGETTQPSEPETIPTEPPVIDEGPAAQGTCGENLTWSFYSEAQLLIIEGTGAMEDYPVDYWNEAPWSEAVYNTVVISEGVTSIGSGAFLRAFGLETIYIPSTLTSIGEGGFSYCYDLHTVYIASANIVEQLTSEYAYDGLIDNATSLMIEQSIATIPEYIMDHYVPGEMVEHNSSIYTVYSYFASGSCGDNLTWELDSAAGVLTIKGTGAMDDYKWGLSGNTESFREGSSAPWYNDRRMFHTIVISADITDIGENAFRDIAADVYISSAAVAEQLNTVSGSGYLLDENNIMVEASIAFESGFLSDFYTRDENKICDGVEYAAYKFNHDGTCGDYMVYDYDQNSGVLTIDGVGEMYDYGDYMVIFNCGSPFTGIYPEFADVVICEGVTSIGTLAFYFCEEFESIAIPRSLTHIGSDAFEGCFGLAVVKIRSSAIVEQLTSAGACDGLIDYAAVIYIESSVTNVPEYVINSYPYTETVVDNGVEYIAYCTSACDLHGHQYETTVVEPTCKSKGYTLHTCTACGDTYKENYVDKVDHSYEDKIVEPTCTKQGYTKKTCVYCGKSYKVDYTDPIEHQWEITEVSEPTCMSRGYTKKTCSACGQTSTEWGEFAPHIPTGESFYLPPTCTERGGTCYCCANCGYGFIETIEAPLGHDWDEQYACIRCGEFSLELEALVLDENGNYMTGGDEQVYISLIQSGLLDTVEYYQTEGTAEYYFSLTYWDQLLAAADEAGYVPLTEETLVWIQDLLFGGEQASVITEEELHLLFALEPCAHDYMEIVTEPTCVVPGYTIYVCQLCGDRFEGYAIPAVPALGHVDENSDDICDVCDELIYIRGDADGDDDVDSDDAIYLLYHTFNETEYPLNQSGDMDGDGDVDSDDAIYLLYYTFNPEEYPLP